MATPSELLQELQLLRQQLQFKDEIIATQAKEIQLLQHRNSKLEEGLQHRDGVIGQLSNSRKLAFSACRSFTEQIIQETNTKVDKVKRQLHMERQHIADLYKDLQVMRAQVQASKAGSIIWDGAEDGADEDLAGPESPQGSDTSTAVDDMCTSPPPATSISLKPPTSSRVLCSWAGEEVARQSALELDALLDEIFAEENGGESDDSDAYVTW